MNVLPKVQFEHDESKGTQLLDLSCSNGQTKTWGEYSKLHVISEDNTSTPCFFFISHFFPEEHICKFLDY